jgi:hypothetical protein
MKVIGCGRWLANKLDCDKWAWLYKAYIIIRNALSNRPNAIPIGLVCYLQNGDKDLAHAINNAIWTKGNVGGFQLGEIEPQPNAGILKLTKAERESVWLVVV